jgi:putative SOS response-associated peptidase YedK
MSAVPFKANADRRHHIPKQQDRVTNWRKLMALAGLWESWRSPAGERVRSFAIITTEPNELCAALHNRMPAILAPQAWPEWLGEQPADEA